MERKVRNYVDVKYKKNCYTEGGKFIQRLLILKEYLLLNGNCFIY